MNDEIKWKDKDNIELKLKGIPRLGCSNPACIHHNMLSSLLCDRCKKERKKAK